MEGGKALPQVSEAVIFFFFFAVTNTGNQNRNHASAHITETAEPLEHRFSLLLLGRYQ